MTVSASKIAAIAACAFFLAAPAFAGKTDMQTLNVAAPSKKETLAIKADTKALESAGLYRSAEEGSLGRDLWKDIKRSTLVRLLQDMPVSSKEPAVQRLIFGALLTQANSGMIENDIPLEPGNDLLTLRLEKLIEAGAYRQAQDFYSSFEDLEPYHERLARAGILAMMLNGEKSLACVEANTMKVSFPDSNFVRDVLAFCDVMPTDYYDQKTEETLAAMKLKNIQALVTMNSTDVYVYDPVSFEGLSLLEKAFLTAQKRISFEKSKITDVEKIPAPHLRILLTDETLSPKNRFLLTVAAQNYGLAIPGELQDVYKASVTPASGQSMENLQVPDKADDWEKLAYNHIIASNAQDDAARWAALRKALALSKNYGIAAISPYADMVAKISPEDATFDEIEIAVRLMVWSNRDIPSFWGNQVENLPLTDAKNPLNQRAYALKTAVFLQEGKDASLPEQTAFPYPSESKSGYLLKNIIENLDKSASNSDNAEIIYEKDFGLTYKADYVMPTVTVWNSLLEVGQNSKIGETVLLSASVLQTDNIGNIYPGLLDDVLTGLNKVGLTNISSNLASSAVLGNVQKN